MQKVRESEAGEAAMAGKQSLLHEAVFPAMLGGSVEP